jgi:peroxiredoxin
MALTPTTNIPLGFKAPHFSLHNVVTNQLVSFDDVAGPKGTLVMFICNHCPFVIHVQEQLVQLANDYMTKGIGFVAISSNDVVNYPQDGPEEMKKLALTLKFPFPYCYDKTQEVAKQYDAACTPDFSLFNTENTCVYRGELDDSRPGNNLPVTGNSMRKVLDTLIKGETIDKDQKPSVGCNIKWKTNA